MMSMLFSIEDVLVPDFSNHSNFASSRSSLLVLSTAMPGGDNRLAVVLSASSYPNVVCDSRDTAPSMFSCLMISDFMEATHVIKTFGEDQQVQLPWEGESSI